MHSRGRRGGRSCCEKASGAGAVGGGGDKQSADCAPRNSERQARGTAQFNFFVPACLRARVSVVVACPIEFRNAFVGQSKASSRPWRGALRTRGRRQARLPSSVAPCRCVGQPEQSGAFVVLCHAQKEWAKDVVEAPPPGRAHAALKRRGRSQHATKNIAVIIVAIATAERNP